MLKFLQYSINNILEDANYGDMYIVVGNHIGTTTNNEITSDRMIYGKRVTSNDYRYIIEKNVWESNTLYDTYLEANTNPYYIINQNNDVYKCIWNNNNAVSTAEPITRTNDLIETSDGYVWKYMYSVSAADLAKFGTTTQIPVSANVAVEANAVAGTIDFVRVDDGGDGYIVFDEGRVTRVFNQKVVKIADTASAVTDVYKGSSFYIKNGTGAGSIKTIDGSYANSSGKYIEFSTNTTVSVDSEYVISPRIDIEDRLGTGFLAYCTVDDGRIDEVIVLDKGQGYVNPTFSFYTDAEDVTTPTITPFISPRAGHGADIISELAPYRMYMTHSFALNESDTLPNTDFTYYQAALIFNPTVDTQSQNTISYGVSIDANNALSVDDYVVGESSNASGYVYWANTTHFKLNNVRGNFSNSENVILESNTTINDINIVKQNDGSGGDILFRYNSNTGIDRELNTSEDIGFFINLGT